MLLRKGIFEDVGAIIGAQAAISLAGWQDGAPVYIPTTPPPDHHLCPILNPDDPTNGHALLQRLAAEFGGETLCLPKVAQLDYMRQRGQIYRHLKKGVSVRCIAHDVGLGERQIAKHRRWLEQHGLIPYILRTPPDGEQLRLLFQPGKSGKQEQ